MLDRSRNAVMTTDAIKEGYCFIGQFDNKVRPGTAEAYALYSEKLSNWTEHPEYGYLFRAAKAMCDVLAIKYDIGVRTRSAYLSRDLDRIPELTTVMK
jgi:hypothetical protein